LVPHTAYEAHGGLSNGPSRTFAILAGSLSQTARGKIKAFHPSSAAAATKATMANTPMVQGNAEKASLVVNGLRKVIIALLLQLLNLLCFANQHTARSFCSPPPM
jgi:hypothetical protein